MRWMVLSFVLALALLLDDSHIEAAHQPYYVLLESEWHCSHTHDKQLTNGTLNVCDTFSLNEGTK